MPFLRWLKQEVISTALLKHITYQIYPIIYIQQEMARNVYIFRVLVWMKKKQFFFKNKSEVSHNVWNQIYPRINCGWPGADTYFLLPFYVVLSTAGPSPLTEDLRYCRSIRTIWTITWLGFWKRHQGPSASIQWQFWDHWPVTLILNESYRKVFMSTVVQSPPCSRSPSPVQKVNNHIRPCYSQTVLLWFEGSQISLNVDYCYPQVFIWETTHYKTPSCIHKAIQDARISVASNSGTIKNRC